MPVVISSGSRTSITQKKAAKVTVQSVREPSSLQDMGDIDFGTLDSTKDGYVISYDSAADKFVLITADDLLTTAAEDSNLDDSFISAIESEIDLGRVATTSLDGGTF